MITLRLNSLWGTQVEKSWNTEAACSRCWLLVGIVCTYQWNFLASLSSTFSTSHLWSFRNLVELALFPRLVTMNKSPHSLLILALLTHLRWGVNWHFVSLDSASSWKSCGQQWFSRKKAEEILMFICYQIAGRVAVGFTEGGQGSYFIHSPMALLFSHICNLFKCSFSSN